VRQALNTIGDSIKKENETISRYTGPSGPR